MNSTQTRLERLFVMGAATVGVLSVGALASAYWSEGGTGTAHAGAGSVVAPANVVAAASAGSAPVPTDQEHPCRGHERDVDRRVDARDGQPAAADDQGLQP